MIEREKSIFNLLRDLDFQSIANRLYANPKLIRDPITALQNQKGQGYFCHSVIIHIMRFVSQSPGNVGANKMREIQNGITHVLRIVKELDLQIFELRDKSGNHFLHVAASYGLLQTLRIFYKADLINNLSEDSLLMSAVRFNRFQCVRFLVGVEPWILHSNKFGQDALDIARQLMCVDCIPILEQSKRRLERVLTIAKIANSSNDGNEDFRALKRILQWKDQIQQFLYPLF